MNHGCGSGVWWNRVVEHDASVNWQEGESPLKKLGSNQKHPFSLQALFGLPSF